MASPEHFNHQHFNFFSLPRELRDQIYALLGSDIQIRNPEVVLGRLTVINAPSSALRLVNHQFKHELEKELARRRSLLITCIIADAFRQHVPRLLYEKDLPSFVARVERVQLHIFLGWIEGSQVVNERLGRIGAEMPALRRALPALKKINLVCHTSTRAMERFILESHLDVSEFLDIHPAFRERDDIIVEQFLQIRGPLCTPRPPLALDFGGDADARSRFLYHGTLPTVIYKATRAQDYEGWHGLELQTLNAEELNYNEHLTRFKMRYPSLDYSRL